MTKSLSNNSFANPLHDKIKNKIFFYLVICFNTTHWGSRAGSYSDFGVMVSGEFGTVKRNKCMMKLSSN